VIGFLPRRNSILPFGYKLYFAKFHHKSAIIATVGEVTDTLPKYHGEPWLNHNSTMVHG